MSRLTKKNIIAKTIQIGFFTLLSRVFGFIRQMFLARYLGAGVISDAFLTAFRIPNSLRKVFAEGALSAALIPSIVHTAKKDGQSAASRLVTLSFVIIEAILLVVCIGIWFYADNVVTVAAPGFSHEQHAAAVPLLKVLIAYIMFISSSAVLAGGLQAVNHFFVPASAQIFVNIIFIGTLMLCLRYDLPVIYLAYGIIFSGLIQTLLHFWAYFYTGLHILMPTQSTWVEFGKVLGKFFPCLITMSIMEINLFIDGQFASYLQQGSITFISYSADFMRIPLGVFAVAFSTILLPHFSRVFAYAPKRLSFYLLESIKMIVWISLPAALLMGFFAHDIFYTTYYGKNFTLYDVQQVSSLLQAFLCGLIFFSVNKILVNIYYAFHSTVIPTIISIISTVVNIGLNYLLMHQFAAWGLVIATSLSAGVQMILFLAVLHYHFNFKLYFKPFFGFLKRYIAQLIVIMGLFCALYYVLVKTIAWYAPEFEHILLKTFVLWLWVTPLCILAVIVLYFTRKFFGIKLHFLK